MKERPILFTGVSIPMVMDGTKTQTRRLVDMGRLSVDIPITVTSDLPGIMPLRVAKPGRHRVRLNPHGAVTCLPMELGLKPGEFHFRCPLVDGTTHLADLGKDKKVWTITPVGEQRLWVKETWGLHSHGDETDWFRGSVRGIQDDSLRAQFALARRADWGPLQEGCFWRPGIFMPRRASRTNLIVVSARLQPLQCITDEDAIAEGVNVHRLRCPRGSVPQTATGVALRTVQELRGMLPLAAPRVRQHVEPPPWWTIMEPHAHLAMGPEPLGVGVHVQKGSATMTPTLCGICDQPAVAEIAPGKPVCAECLAMPEEERRRAGLQRMFSDEAKNEPFWHFLSFADEQGFLGACWVKARGILDAVTIARQHGCNPGGEVLCQPLRRWGEPPEQSANMLYTDKAEIDRLCALWARTIGQ